MTYAMLTVAGEDQAGIIAAVTGILFNLRCNLEDISMTILEGEFAMMLVLCLPEGQNKARIIRALQRDLDQWHLSFFWKDLERKKIRRGEKHLQNSTTYIVTAMGKDCMGIVYKVSRLFAEERLNITDLNSKILGRGKKSIYTMLLEVDIPKSFPIEKVRRRLNRLATQLQIELQLKPLERIEL